MAAALGRAVDRRQGPAGTGDAGDVLARPRQLPELFAGRDDAGVCVAAEVEARSVRAVVRAGEPDASGDRRWAAERAAGLVAGRTVPGLSLDRARRHLGGAGGRRHDASDRRVRIRAALVARWTLDRLSEFGSPRPRRADGHRAVDALDHHVSRRRAASADAGRTRRPAVTVSLPGRPTASASCSSRQYVGAYRGLDDRRRERRADTPDGLSAELRDAGARRRRPRVVLHRVGSAARRVARAVVGRWAIDGGAAGGVVHAD